MLGVRIVHDSDRQCFSDSLFLLVWISRERSKVCRDAINVNLVEAALHIVAIWVWHDILSDFPGKDVP